MGITFGEGSAPTVEVIRRCPVGSADRRENGGKQLGSLPHFYHNEVRDGHMESGHWNPRQLFRKHSKVPTFPVWLQQTIHVLQVKIQVCGQKKFQWDFCTHHYDQIERVPLVLAGLD